MLGRLVGHVGGGGGLVEDLPEAQQDHHRHGARDPGPEQQRRVPGSDEHHPCADDRQGRPLAQGDGGGQFQEQDHPSVQGDDEPEGARVQAVVGEEDGEGEVLLAVDDVGHQDRAEQHQHGGAGAQFAPQAPFAAARTPVLGRGGCAGSAAGRDDPCGPEGEDERADAVADEEPVVGEAGGDQGAQRRPEGETAVGGAAYEGEGLAAGSLRDGDRDECGVGGPDHAGGVLGHGQGQVEERQGEQREGREGQAPEGGCGEQHPAVAEAVSVPAAGEVAGDQADAADSGDEARLGGAEAARAGQVEEDEDEGEADDGVDEDPRSQQPHHPRYVLEPLQHTRAPLA